MVAVLSRAVTRTASGHDRSTVYSESRTRPLPDRHPHFHPGSRTGRLCQRYRLFDDATSHNPTIGERIRGFLKWLSSWQHSTMARRVTFLQSLIGDPQRERHFQIAGHLVALGASCLSRRRHLQYSARWSDGASCCRRFDSTACSRQQSLALTSRASPLPITGQPYQLQAQHIAKSPISRRLCFALSVTIISTHESCRRTRMTLTCPRCHRSLSTDDGGDAPSFCMYCGHKLRQEAKPFALMRTGSYEPGRGLRRRRYRSLLNPRPQSIGGYRLLRLLGSGGMGTVYEAEAPGSGQHVAVKLLSSRLASSPASIERFRQEGRLASQVAHPRCVFVLSADTDAGRPYIVMELMPGETLKDLVDQRGPLPPDVAITRILDVVDGLPRPTASA